MKLLRIQFNWPAICINMQSSARKGNPIPVKIVISTVNLFPKTKIPSLLGFGWRMKIQPPSPAFPSSPTLNWHRMSTIVLQFPNMQIWRTDLLQVKVSLTFSYESSPSPTGTRIAREKSYFKCTCLLTGKKNSDFHFPDRLIVRTWFGWNTGQRGHGGQQQVLLSTDRKRRSQSFSDAAGWCSWCSRASCCAVFGASFVSHRTARPEQWKDWKGSKTVIG